MLRGALCALGLLALGAPASARPAPGGPARARAAAARPFRPRLGRAMGLVAPLGRADIARGPREPVVYHGGVVMRRVRLHTVFWAPAGFAFGGSPGPGVPGYEPFLQRFVADSAQSAGSAGNLYSVLAQYGDSARPRSGPISYDPRADSVHDTTRYPPVKAQCSSPSGILTCLTGAELERELDRVVSRTAPSARGLHDLWILLLPANVDTCTQPGVCGTSDFAGYHSAFDLGHGLTAYAVVVDPLIEQTPTAGADPEGNPDAESAANVVAHELVEGITDPVGTGWMDPDGYEVGDKCDTAEGTPLGYANGSPYNEVLGGRRYLLQAMWSNVAHGCVQSGAAPAPEPDSARVSLRQFSATVTGNAGHRRAGLAVTVRLRRGGAVVASGRGRTRADGSWRATLLDAHRAPLGVGDDRDQIAVSYGDGGPARELISTGSGGNPYTESGWTGWFELDHGYAIGAHSVALAPCGQVGVLALRVGAALLPAVVEKCQTEADAAVVRTPAIGPRSAVSLTSTDNRAVWPRNPLGALVSLTVALGEPGSVSAVRNDQVLLTPSGFPTCTADLRAQTVSCRGLVAHERYRLARRRGRVSLRARAGGKGGASFGSPSGTVWVRGGDVLTLRNRVGRAVTVLHVAHLRVDVRGAGRRIAGGSCQPGEYWGPPLARPPLSGAVGDGVAGTGRTCAASGRAAGLPAAAIEQTDSLGGGLTRTEVPTLASFSPAAGATLYGGFIALAEPALARASGALAPVRAPVALAISRRGSGHVLLRLSGLERPQGVAVPALARGVYAATWTVGDAAGDTRTIETWFVVER